MRTLVLVIVGMSSAALAQEADGGSAVDGDADGGDGGSIWLPFDGGIATPVDFPGRLAAGSEAGAGIDVGAAGEIVHPSNPTALVAALKTLAGVFQGGKASAVVQVNPYMVKYGDTQFYDDFVAARRGSVVDRLLQDSTITVAAAPGAPYVGQPADLSRFATAGAGASVELLGDRSIFSDSYSKCLDDLMLARTKAPPVPPHGFVQKQGESDDAYKARIAKDPRVQAYLASKDAREKVLSKGVAGCTQKSATSTKALFISTGGRWVTPGSQPEGDRVTIQRAYGAAAFEWFTDSQVEFALQARALGERLQAGTALAQVFDAGLSVKWSGTRVQLGLEATQSLAQWSGNSGVGTITGTAHVKLNDDWNVAIGVQGKGKDVVDAVQQVTASISLSFEGVPVFQKAIPRP